uniref:Uncharacterized protein n=1 Tax=Solanum tuberosum TaxID=4113 RepID=M1DFV7_SOLTU
MSLNQNCYGKDAARRIRPWCTLLETLTGCAITPTDMDGAGQIRDQLDCMTEDQWQRDTPSASNGEEVSQIVMDTLLEAGIQFIEPFFEGDPLFEHARAKGCRFDIY